MASRYQPITMDKQREYDYLIVGAGLFGATVAWRARQAGLRCMVIDRRSHLGGNVYCESCEGIHVHKYGAHIFHTSSDEVWQFVNSLVPFNRYTNSPLACYQGRFYNLPFNMNTFHQMWGVTTPAEAQCRLEEQRREAVEAMRSAGVSETRNLEEQALMLIGRDIYQQLIKGYTEKQWGRPCTELPAFIIKRLPVRLTFDNNYFNDRYQGIPVGGYNRLVDRLLDGIETRTGCDYFEDRSYWETVARRTVFTGQIDQFFDYCYGPLEYRSLRFEEQLLNTPNHQGNAVINYTEATIPYTRSIEHKHFESFGASVYENPQTVVTLEYPAEWKPGMEPYYPVNDERNNRLADRYRRLGALRTDVVFGGRLAEYRYYDMAPVVEKALQMEL